MTAVTIALGLYLVIALAFAARWICTDRRDLRDRRKQR